MDIIYAQSLLDFFAQLNWQGKSIPVVLARADRAHASIRKLVQEQQDIELSCASGEIATPYPFITVDLLLPSANTARGNISVTRKVHNGDVERRYGYCVRTPKAVKYPVDMNLFFSSRTQASFVAMQIELMFAYGNVAWVPINFSDSKWYRPPFDAFQYWKMLGEQKLQLNRSNLVDTSVVAHTGLANREIRYTLACSLFGWIMYPPFPVPIVHTAEFRVHADSTHLVHTVQKDN